MDLIRLDLDTLIIMILAKEVQILALTLEEAETAGGVRR